jgi:uracil-DNA glycosylase
VLLLNPTLTVEIGRVGSHLDCGWQALTFEIVGILSRQTAPPVFLLWGSKAQAFFDAARPHGVDLPVLRTRHPSNDFKRDFMAEGSHFDATSGLVDWWRRGG